MLRILSEATSHMNDAVLTSVAFGVGTTIALKQARPDFIEAPSGDWFTDSDLFMVSVLVAILLNSWCALVIFLLCGDYLIKIWIVSSISRRLPFRDCTRCVKSETTELHLFTVRRNDA